MTVMQIPNAPPNPMVIAAYVAATLLSLPVILALVRLIFFFATATTKLDGLGASVEGLTADVKQLLAESAAREQGVEFSLAIIENDVNVLQGQAGLPLRPFPDRRTGPFDRRHSAA